MGRLLQVEPIKMHGVIFNLKIVGVPYFSDITGRNLMIGRHRSVVEKIELPLVGTDNSIGGVDLRFKSVVIVEILDSVCQKLRGGSSIMFAG